MQEFHIFYSHIEQIFFLLMGLSQEEANKNVVK